MSDSITRINWVDIFIVIIIGRSIFIGLKAGFTIELFKLLGTLTALLAALHFYFRLTVAFAANFPFIADKISLKIIAFFAFIFLAALGYCVWIFLRMVLSRFLKLEAMQQVNKIGGLVLGFFRGLLLIGLILFGFSLSKVNYLRESTYNSFLGEKCVTIAPGAYSWFWGNLFSKLNADSQYNDNVNKITEKEIR